MNNPSIITRYKQNLQKNDVYAEVQQGNGAAINLVVNYLQIKISTCALSLIESAC
ncbi:MAG: hypothetical protein JJP05_05480 [cyanobacterium endosymbiont of Rhopalodia gibba]